MRDRLVPLAVLAVALAVAGLLAALAGAAFDVRDAEADGVTDRIAKRILVVEREGGPLSTVAGEFRASHAPGVSAEALAEERAQARIEAERVLERRARRAHRSYAANLLGILSFEDAALEPNQAGEHLGASVLSFQEAVRLNRQNADAKFNLELLLTLLEGTDVAEGGSESASGGTQPAGSAGAATSGGGSGY